MKESYIVPLTYAERKISILVRLDLIIKELDDITQQIHDYNIVSKGLPERCENIKRLAEFIKEEK